MRQIIILALAIVNYGTPAGPTNLRPMNPNVSAIAEDPTTRAAANTIDILRRHFNPEVASYFIYDDFQFRRPGLPNMDKDQFIKYTIDSGRFDPGNLTTFRTDHDYVLFEFEKEQMMTYFSVYCGSDSHPVITGGHRMPKESKWVRGK